MSNRCYKCFKPENACLCKYIKNFDPCVKFLFLMHPKEFKRNRTGTGYLSHATLKNSEVLVDLDFSKNIRLQELLSDSKYFPVIMFPGEDALTAKTENLNIQLSNKTLLVMIIDATWFCAKKLIEKNPFLLKYPKFSFYGSYQSIFTFKHEPKPEYISTIETCYYFIKELQENNIIDKSIQPEPLMTVFKEMIKFQLKAENERILGLRPNTHNYDSKYNKVREIPNFDAH